MDTTEKDDGRGMLLDQIAAAVMVIDKDGVIRHANRHVRDDLDLAHDAIVGKHCRQVFWPEFMAYYDNIVAECATGEEFCGIYYWAAKTIWEQICARNIVWESRPSILMTITNVSEIVYSKYHSENIAYFDNLLGLPNGAKLEEDINDLANVETVALLYFEIDRFEDVNELYGWDSGNDLLAQVRDWLLASEIRRAQLYRINNGFASLGRKLSREDAEERAAEIRDRFKKPWVLSAGGKSIFLYFTVKIGIVHGKYIKNEMRNLLLRTIRAAAGKRNGTAVYDEEEDRKAKRVLVIRDSFINSLYNDMTGFDVHYQPIVDVATKRWVAVEALCRWTTPDGERIPPVDFILAAEHLNLIEYLDSWVRGTAMRQCASLGLDRLDFSLGVNFSPTQRLNDVFRADLFRSLHDSRYPPDKLNIEITESTRMVFDDENIAGLGKLKRHGITLSLDDFGTGYSSMENLIKISADAIKIDKVFMEGVENDSYRQYLLKMLVDLAHHLKMNLIAEGVETEGEFALVSKYGVDRVQGYLFSKPLPFDLLKHERWRFEKTG